MGWDYLAFSYTRLVVKYTDRAWDGNCSVSGRTTVVLWRLREFLYVGKASTKSQPRLHMRRIRRWAS